MKKIFYIALTIVLGLAGTLATVRNSPTTPNPEKFQGKPELSIFLLSMPYPIMT